MPLPSNRRITPGSAMLICIEALAISVQVLVIITFVAGRYNDSLRGLSTLTFDTSSVRADRSISNVQDWYEPHYLSVCKGMWQFAGSHIKDPGSTVCTSMSMGYTFSLPELLAADAGLPVDSPVLAAWGFAVLHTSLMSVCLVIAMTFLNWAILDYGIAIYKTWGLVAGTPLFWVWQGFIPSIPAVVVLILESAELTARTHKIIQADAAVKDGVVWTTGGFYVLTWLTTALMCVEVILSVVLLFKLRKTTGLRRGEPDSK